jgi:DNA primase large subunit
MEIVRSHRQIAAEAAAGVGCGGGAGGLPTYRVAPQLEVRLEEFELFAIDRLRVLKGIADGLSRGKRPEEMEKLVSRPLSIYLVAILPRRCEFLHVFGAN